eukprot:4777246-Pyramimonas_sp.AAC.1
MFHGSDFEALDQAEPLLDELQRTRELQQWRAAATHFCGDGVADGVDMVSLQAMIFELQDVKKGRQLSD